MSSVDGDKTLLEGLDQVDDGAARGTSDLVSHCKMTDHDILDMKVQSFNEVDIQEEDDEELSYIPGCCFLSNGDVVLCDYYNHKLKLLDRNWTMKRSFNLPGPPWDIAVFNEHELIVSFPRLEKLQFVRMFPDLELGHEIALGAECCGLDVFEDEIYTAVETEIWKLDKAGNVTSRVNIPRVFTYSPDFLRLSKSGSIPRVYLTDRACHKLLCLEIDGTVVFQYEHEDQECLGGIYVDSKGNSFVCATESSNIVVITADGKKHTNLLTEMEITRPTSIAFRPEDGTLVVGCRRTSKLFVSKLAK